MITDPRGGFNRKNINTHFFKSWSPNMAYVLGFILADGAIEDVRNSSRTCYISISSNDTELLLQIKKVLNSNHKIYNRKPRINIFPGNKKFFCKESHLLRIGNKEMFQDLVYLGITPRKSLTIKLPRVPQKFFNYFVRGYFDGDGCVYISKPNDVKKRSVAVIFASGSRKLLYSLSIKLQKMVHSNFGSLHKNGKSLQLSYKKKDSLKILEYIYTNLYNSPFLKRKHDKYENYLKSLN